MKLEDIQIRDPFFLKDGSKWYLYGTTDHNPWDGPGTGFDCYVSNDQMQTFTRKSVFRPNLDFWGKENFWAPEVREFDHGYLMTASFKGTKGRGVQLLMAPRPEGPFLAIGNEAVTPSGQDCLDGTIWIEDNRLFLIYSHEWTQCIDGEICLLELDQTTFYRIGQPEILFRASDAPWTVFHEEQGKQGFVTDGPFIWRLSTGRLAMIWSSFSSSGYSMGVAYSDHGVHGPWIQQQKPLYDKNGGHGMLFRFQDDLMLAIHVPNTPGKERVLLFQVREENNQLKLGG